MSVENKNSPRAMSRDTMHDHSGVYTYEDDNVTLISQPTFEDTLAAITEQPSKGTTIVTPELSLLGDAEFHDFLHDETQRNEAMQLLRERFLRLKDASFNSSNLVITGMPTRSADASRPRNSVTAVMHGTTVNMQHKVNPGSYEEQLEVFDYPERANYYHRFGTTALICSELVFTLNLDPSLKQATNTLLVPAAWGVPSSTPAAIEEHGSVDKYHQYTLTTTAKVAAIDLPNLDKIYVADRPVDGNKPQIGRFVSTKTGIKSA